MQRIIRTTTLNSKRSRQLFFFFYVFFFCPCKRHMQCENINSVAIVTPDTENTETYENDAHVLTPHY